MDVGKGVILDNSALEPTNLLNTAAAGNTFHPYCFAINIHGHLSHLKTMLMKKTLS